MDEVDAFTDHDFRGNAISLQKARDLGIDVKMRDDNDPVIIRVVGREGRTENIMGKGTAYEPGRETAVHFWICDQLQPEIVLGGEFANGNPGKDL
jgi:hypothetical protein